MTQPLPAKAEAPRMSTLPDHDSAAPTPAPLPAVADTTPFDESLDVAVRHAHRLASELAQVHAALTAAAATDYRVRATRYRFQDAQTSCRYAADELAQYRQDGPRQLVEHVRVNPEPPAPQHPTAGTSPTAP